MALLNYIINQGGWKRIEIQNVYTYSSDISHHLEKFHSINTLNLIHKDHIMIEEIVITLMDILVLFCILL